MPYNPVITNNTGYSRGIEMAAEGLANGIRQYQQNQFIKNKALGRFTGLAKNNPELEGYLGSDQVAPAVVKAFTKVSSGKDIDLHDAALLSEAASAFVDEKNEASKRQLQASEVALRNQQIAASQAGMAQQAKDEAALTNALAPFTRTGAMRGAIQQGSNFQNLPTQGQKFDPGLFLHTYFGNGGSPSSLDRVDNVIKMFAPPQSNKPGPIIFSSEAELEKRYPKAQYDYNFAPGPDGTVLITDGKISPRGPQIVQPEIPNPINERIYGDLSKEREAVMPLVRGAAAYADVEKDLADASTGKIISGAFANPELVLRKIGASILGYNDKDVVKTETVRAQLAQNVMSVIKALGSGTGVSDTDLKFVQEAVGSNMGSEEETIKKLVALGRKYTDLRVKDYGDRVLAAFPEDDPTPTAKRARAALSLPKSAPVESPKAAATPATSLYREGQMATNPKTGETLVFRGGKWVKQ